LGLGFSGCGQRAPQVSGGDAKLPADDGSPAYIDRLSSEKTVTENDALRGVLMFLGHDDANDTFQQRVDEALRRGLAERTWTFQAGRPVTKGKIAYMICRACEIRGGLILMLTGPSQRYCLRELQYMEMMPPGSIFSKVSGMEMVALLARADAYRTRGEVPEVLKVSEAMEP
jgi:hypothetical protein